MALPNVQIILQNGQLGGLPAFAEGVAAIIGTGTAVNQKIQIGDPRLVMSLDDAETIGITTNDNPAMHRHVKEFYEEAGSGKELYVMIVPNTMTLTQMCDKTEAGGIKKLLDYAKGRVRLWTCYFVPAQNYTPVVTNGIDDDVYTAIAKAQATCEEYATNHTPCRAIVEGRHFNDTAADLTDLHTLTANRVAVLLGGTLNDKSCSVGLALGRLAKIPVQRKMSRVKDGPVQPVTLYIGTKEAATVSTVELIHDKGFITFRTFAGKAGYFFNRDWTAVSATDDYATLSRGRVIDKAAVLAYVTYLEELDDEVIINPDGTMSIGSVKYLESKIENVIAQSMQANGEVSSVAVYIDPTQNITVSEVLKVSLQIGSVAYNGTIKVLLGFKSTNN